MPNKLKILIIGSGGREHAIGWKVAQSMRAGQIFFAPGNAGTMQIGTNVGIEATNISKLLEFAKKEKIDLTIATSRDSIALGIVDEFTKSRVRIFGPTKIAAQLEWSKSLAKEFMRTFGLPTARFKSFTNYTVAKDYIDKQKPPYVIKASGLNQGKGVFIAHTKAEGFKAVEDLMEKKILSTAGEEVVIEELLEGALISLHAFSDGKTYKMLPVSQGHTKTGSITPAPFVTRELEQDLARSIVAPTIFHMKEEGVPFAGILYPDLMLTLDGPRVLSFNARFGESEVQSYMRLLETDLLDIIDACIDGNLDKIEIKWRSGTACTIILTNTDTKEGFKIGTPIAGVESAEMSKNIVVFHADTSTKDGQLISTGSQVLGISATGKDLPEALGLAYEAIKKIKFEGMTYDKDVGQEALALAP